MYTDTGKLSIWRNLNHWLVRFPFSNFLYRGQYLNKRQNIRFSVRVFGGLYVHRLAHAVLCHEHIQKHCVCIICVCYACRWTNAHIMRTHPPRMGAFVGALYVSSTLALKTCYWGYIMVALVIDCGTKASWPISQHSYHKSYPKEKLYSLQNMTYKDSIIVVLCATFCNDDFIKNGVKTKWNLPLN